MNKTLLTIAALAGVLTLSSITSAPAAEDDYGDKQDVAFAKQVWKAMDGYQDWRLTTALFKGASPHGKLVRLYSTWITVDKQIYPIIVKDNYGGRGMTEEKVAEDPATWHRGVTVMVQRERGYDKDGMDWFYAKYDDGEIAKNPEGKLLAGRVGKGEKRGGCVSCHSQAAGDDFLYSNDH